MATKDFYKTLGVSEKASADEIKKAYRKLAKKYHPDVTGGDKAKEAKFKEISEAYETLGDEKKRAQYDEMKHNPFAGAGGVPGGGARPGAGGGFPGGAQGFDINDLFSQFGGRGAAAGGGPRVYSYSSGGGAGEDAGGFGDIFEMFRGGGAGGAQAKAGPRKGQDVIAKLEIDLTDAALGAEKQITVDGKQLKVKIPAGVKDGQAIRLAGQGSPAPRGGQPGDLLIELHEKPNPRLRRRAENPYDIEVEVPVPVDVAVLGGKATVPTLEGTTVTLTIPAGSSSGRKLRLKEKGAMQPGGKGRGDLYAVVSVQVPTELPPKARELMEEFAKLTKK
jgi:DnaJ-class molecular chaperone